MNKIQIMTHLVVAYRNFDETKELVDLMLEKKVDYLEVQLAFSDPFGDGATITHANQCVIDMQYTISQLMDCVAQLCLKSDVPVFVMTYTNIAYKMGYIEFFDALTQAGVSGAIIPDLPFLTPDHEIIEAIHYAKKINLVLVPVISPNISEKRLEELMSKLDGSNTLSMVYCTQRTGITGTHNSYTNELATYLNMVKTHSSCKITAGFGISSPQKVQNIIGLSDIAVIGSHIINLYSQKDIKDKKKFQEVAAFLDEINAIRA